MVGTVYYALLRNVGHAQGWALFFEHVLHYVTPPLFVLDWLLFVPKGEVAWRNGIACLGFPAAYVGWTLAHGAVSGWYPYPFVDVPALGYPADASQHRRARPGIPRSRAGARRRRPGRSSDARVLTASPNFLLKLWPPVHCP